MINEELFNQSIEIYRHMADEKSRYIFKERLLYLMTRDVRHIKNIIKTNKEGLDFCELLNSDEDIYIFGAGAWGREFVEVWPDRWKGVLDNNEEKWGTEFIPGVKIYSPMEVIRQEFTGKILISSRLYYEEIRKQLISIGVPESNILNVGLVLDELAEKQYFSLENIPYGNNEVFVDVGSLDGKTTLQFIKRNDNFMKAYCFEPDTKNIEKCKGNLEQYIKEERVKIIEKGAWSSNETLYFSMNGNGTSTVADEGEKIEVVTLDSVLSNQGCTFIKMDIEGAEWHALQGASDIIRKQKPKLAISIYHKPEDILVLPSLILEMNPEYRLYLRHYSLAAAETVLYAI